jgi:A/G-specific adenine glycosylase
MPFPGNLASYHLKMEAGNPKKQHHKFPSLLLKWNIKNNSRTMPWKGEKDPYKIWLSEIILQQTRVEQGWPYYLKFISAFPQIEDLAKAPEKEVFKLWEGLGYYSRCRNLIVTAKLIVSKWNGRFPSTYDDIISLKGIGPYTAAAISSFAFNLPYPVVDGNVYRVLSRISGKSLATDSTKGKKYFHSMANELLDKKIPGIYNQALMDFGATICKPASPLCNECFFEKNCMAFLLDRVDELPVKRKKINIRSRRFYFFYIEYKGKMALQRRDQKDIWQGLYEFPMIEMERNGTLKSVLKLAEKNNWLHQNEYDVESCSPSFIQKLTHQRVKANFIHIRIKNDFLLNGTSLKWQWVSQGRLGGYSFPRIIRDFLES